MLNFIHNSFDAYFRFPFGAIPTGERLTLRVFAENGECLSSDAIKLRLWADNTERIYSGERYTCVYGGNSGALFKFEIDMPNEPMLLWYYFIIEHDGVCYLGGTNGVGELTDYPVKSYQVTVYDREFSTPKWFRQTIAYQIFPDRFKRGTARGGLDRISTHTNKGRHVYIHDNWNDEVLYEPLPNCSHYSPIDFFGGDLQGILQSLPYLSRLKIGCIYLNPIFSSPSNHRYDTADYIEIDEVLGSEADFKTLAKHCDYKGIKIMLDGVFSHTGDDSVYFNRFNRYCSMGAYNSKDSEYYEWYDFVDFPDRYRSWWGFLNLPEVNEDNKSYREYIVKVLRKWGTLANVSWRLDVADELTDDFIEMVRSEIKMLGGSTPVLIGEVWEDASNKHSQGGLRRYCSGNTLDGVMNYPLRSNIIDFLLGKITANEFARSMTTLQQNYPKPFMQSCLNILGSHDTVRILSVLGGAPDRDELSVIEQSKFSLSADVRELAKRKLKQAVAIQFSSEGVPCIYYGDELGMEGMADPFCRRPFQKQADSNEIISFYRKICTLRSENACLFEGKALYIGYSDNVFIIIRFLDDKSVITLVNSSDTVQKVELNACTLYIGEYARDFVFADEYKVFDTKKSIKTQNNILTVEIQGNLSLILISK